MPANPRKTKTNDANTPPRRVGREFSGDLGSGGTVDWTGSMPNSTPRVGRWCRSS